MFAFALIYNAEARHTAINVSERGDEGEGERNASTVLYRQFCVELTMRNIFFLDRENL